MKVIFGIILWLCSVPLNYLSVAAAYILGPIVVLFCNKDGWLPKWLWWFQTPDNSMDGDSGWKYEHWMWRYRLPYWLCRYVGRVGWCWRNPCYGFAINVLGAKAAGKFNWYGNRNIRDTAPAIDGWLFVTSGIYWNLYVIAPLFGRTLRLYIGWKLRNGEGRSPYQMVCYFNPFKSRG